MKKAQVCIENYINGNLTDAKKQAERIPTRDLFDAAILAGKAHHVAVLIADYLKHPSQKRWDYLCQHEHGARQQPGQSTQEMIDHLDSIPVYQTAPGHISDAEAVNAQAARIRDLVSENVRLKRQIENGTRLIVAAAEAEQMFRTFAGRDPGACLTAHSEEAEACEMADKLQKAAEHARSDKFYYQCRICGEYNEFVNQCGCETEARS